VRPDALHIFDAVQCDCCHNAYPNGHSHGSHGSHTGRASGHCHLSIKAQRTFSSTLGMALPGAHRCLFRQPFLQTSSACGAYTSPRISPLCALEVLRRAAPEEEVDLADGCFDDNLERDLEEVRRAARASSAERRAEPVLPQVPFPMAPLFTPGAVGSGGSGSKAVVVVRGGGVASGAAEVMLGRALRGVLAECGAGSSDEDDESDSGG